MTAGLRDLYQQVIVDHSKQPRNFRRMTGADRSAEGFNPLCGDRVTVYLQLDGDLIRDISFHGSGCSIFTASASLLTEGLRGKNLSEAGLLFEDFHRLVTGANGNHGGRLGKLAAFAGVADYPMRVKCATLPWHALRSAIQGKDEIATTEQP